jgi:hypothetical protein
MRPCVAKFLSNPPKFAVLTKPILHPLSVMPRVQTDGSFTGRFSRTAVLYRDKNNVDTTQCITYLHHRNSTESEWCSVLDGMLYAAKKDEGFLELENDNLGVIQTLIHQRPPRIQKCRGYYSAILNQLTHFDYVGVRWIPREFNKADDIFRLN